MPTYQYACKEPACGHRFEAVQSFSDEPIATCPECAGQVRKVFSAVGVVFKGSGFYRNDSREPAKSSTPAAKKESKGESGAGASTGSGSDSGSGSGSDSGSGSGSGEKASSTSSKSGSSDSSSGSTSQAAAS